MFDGLTPAACCGCSQGRLMLMGVFFCQFAVVVAVVVSQGEDGLPWPQQKLICCCPRDGRGRLPWLMAWLGGVGRFFVVRCLGRR